MITEEHVAQLMEVFLGFEYAHGRYDANKKDPNGKFRGEAITYKKGVTLEAWQEHVNGTGPNVGIIPLRADNTVVWGAIDIDINNIDHNRMEESIKRLGLPLVVGRSKSGGAHLYLFLKEPTEAALVQKKLATWAALLGHGGVEINPKQTSRVDLENDVGNWLNMPYYNAAKHTLRYVIKDGSALTLLEFLARVDSWRVNLESFEDPVVDINPEVQELFEGGPPCLRTLFSLGGFPEGTRNDGMYNVGTYLRKRFPEDWENRLAEYNARLCVPPLALSEINQLVKSVRKKEYEYRCKHPPIAQHCDRKACLQCPFGVGETENSGRRIEITAITKYVGDPTLWAVEVADKRMMLTTADLFSQTAFNQKCMDILNRLPGTMPKPRWERYLDEQISKADIVVSPPDVSPEGVFYMLLDQFIHGQAQAKTVQEILRNIPWNGGDGWIYFQSTALFKYLDAQNFKYRDGSRHTVWQWLRNIGGENLDQFAIEDKRYRVWRVKDTTEKRAEPQVPDFGGEVF